MNPNFSDYLPVFLLILLRASIFVSFMPIFNSKSFPASFKIGFAVAIAIMLTPIVEIDVKNIPIPFLVIREIVLGIVLGSAVRVLFTAVEVAGQVMSNAMGLSLATVFNPEMGQSTEVARLYGLMAILILLSTDAHHDLIYIFVKSYEWVPVGNIDVKNLVTMVVSGGGRLFILALKIAAPLLAGMLMANLLLGFIYKAAPQMNILFISFPIYIFLGYLIMLISLPVFINVFSSNFEDVKDRMLRLISAAGG